MKQYNKILEAVNRGIRFALDDFEDQEDIQGQVNSKVKYKGGTKEYLDLMNKVVDLGLPSGGIIINLVIWIIFQNIIKMTI